MAMNEKFDKNVEKNDDSKYFSREMLSKTVVSKTGKIFGSVGDLVFEVRTGELIHIVLDDPTAYAAKLELEKDKQGRILIPYNSVIASGDFLVIAEEDIV
ncbi:MAG: PRC-barrel domain-containing protein [Candidatus Woesearchaeota archaeon]